MFTTTQMQVVGSVATQVLLTFICYWSTKSNMSVFCSQHAVIYNYINHIMQCVIFSKWLFLILYCFTFCSFLLWETIMIQMYCCLGNHLPTQGFRGWFQSGDKNVSRNICVRALTQLFSFLWDKHVGLHLLGGQFQSRCIPSIPQPCVGDALSLSILTGIQCCHWFLFWPFNSSYSGRFSHCPIG